MKTIEVLVIVAVLALVVALFAWATARIVKRVRHTYNRSMRRKTIVEIYRPTILERLSGWWLMPSGAIALANALGLWGAKAESLMLDPASSYLNGAWPGRNLLVQRGASGYQYGDLSAGANRPLGVTLDSPYFSGDPFEVHILGAHPGLFIGIVAANTIATIDNLLVSAAGGKVQDITTVGNGSYWVVGKAAATVNAATNSTGEISYVPCLPYQLTVSNGGGTYAYTAPSGH